MSSFEQFKKSQHSHKSNKSNSSVVIYKSFQAQPLNLQNLSFSINQIVFRVGEGQQILTNSELRVTNHTGTRLYFRVRSNNADYYDIRPSQDILDINASVNLSFLMNKQKILMQSRDQHSSPLSKLAIFIRNDAFEFAWGEITEENMKRNETPITSKRQILKVRVEDANIAQKDIHVENRNEYSNRHYNKDLTSQSKNLSEAKILNLDNQSNTEYDEPAEQSSLLTIPIISAVAILSFIIGFVSA